jgi:hypothetical protein
MQIGDGPRQTLVLAEQGVHHGSGGDRLVFGTTCALALAPPIHADNGGKVAWLAGIKGGPGDRLPTLRSKKASRRARTH